MRWAASWASQEKDRQERKINCDSFCKLFCTETHKNVSPSASCTEGKVHFSFEVLSCGSEISAGQVFDQKSDTLLPTNDNVWNWLSISFNDWILALKEYCILRFVEGTTYRCSVSPSSLKALIHLFILFKVLGIRPKAHFGSRTGGAGWDYGLRHFILVHARYLHQM